jgi:hypothetical protein
MDSSNGEGDADSTWTPFPNLDLISSCLLWYVLFFPKSSIVSNIPVSVKLNANRASVYYLKKTIDYVLHY